VKLLSTLVTLAFLSLFTSCFSQNELARKGIFILNPAALNEGAVPLNGEWEFYMSELKAPESFKTSTAHSSTVEYIDFPSTWNHLSKARNPGEGYATYRLRVVTQTPEKLAISLPDIYTSYSLWVNAKHVTWNGQIGTTPETSSPQWRPHTIYLEEESDTLDLILQVSNFSHANGGIREALFIGTHEKMQFRRSISTISNLTLCICLAILGLLFLLLYGFATSREASALYFMALCFNWSIRALFSNDYLFNYYFPDFPWTLCVKIEYVTLYLMMIWAILFLGSIFKNDVSFSFKVLFGLCNGIFTLLTLFFKPSLFTQFLPIYLSFAGLLMIYIVYVLIRAVMHERSGIWLMVSSIFLGVIVFSYNIISYEVQTPFNPIIINSGYLAMFLLTSVILLIDMGYMKRSSKSGSYLTYDELYGRNK
jgi:hypothetical protein